MAATVISIALQKGGVGKTSTALCLSNTLGFKHRKVLLIDFDSQCNTTYSSGVDDPRLTITDVLSGYCAPEEAVIECKYYDLLAADEYLSNVERSDKIEPTLLKDSVQPLLDSYDYIIIDTPPALGNLLFNALVFSDHVIIPTEPRPYELQGMGALYNTIQSVREINHKLNILGILLIKHNNRSNLNRQITDMLYEWADQMNTTIFNTTIRNGIALPASQSIRVPLLAHAKNSTPTIDYKAFTTELLNKLERQ